MQPGEAEGKYFILQTAEKQTPLCSAHQRSSLVPRPPPFFVLRFADNTRKQKSDFRSCIILNANGWGLERGYKRSIFLKWGDNQSTSLSPKVSGIELGFHCTALRPCFLLLVELQVPEAKDILKVYTLVSTIYVLERCVLAYYDWIIIWMHGSLVHTFCVTVFINGEPSTGHLFICSV